MPRMSKKRKQEWALFLNERNRIMLVGVWEPSPISSLPALTAFSQVWMVPSGIPNSLAALVPPISWASFTACTLYSWSYLRATLNTSLFSWFYYEILENRLSTLFIHHHIDAIETASQFGIGADRAVNYQCDSEGTALNYEVVSEAISSVRCSAPLSADWKKRMDEDYKKRGGRKHK